MHETVNDMANVTAPRKKDVTSDDTSYEVKVLADVLSATAATDTVRLVAIAHSLLGIALQSRTDGDGL